MPQAPARLNAVVLQPIHVMTIAAIIGALCVIPFWQQITDQDVQSERTKFTNATLARSIAIAANTSNAPFEELSALALEIEQPLTNTAICAIDRNGDLIFHSKNPDAVGRNVAAVRLGAGQTVADLLTTQSNWTGENLSANNISQIVAYRYWSQTGGLIAVHTPVPDTFSGQHMGTTITLLLSICLLLGGYLWQTIRLKAKLNTDSRNQLLASRTAAIAHDVNNLLTVIQGNADMVLNRAPDARSTTNLRKLIHASDMISQLNRRLSALSEYGLPEPKLWDLKLLLAEFRQQWIDDLNLNTGISFAAQPGLVVQIDQLDFMQILLNLVMNAEHATQKPGDHIEVALNRVQSTPKNCLPRSLNRACVRLSVTDSGPGISPDLLPHLFKQAKPNQPNGHGVGLLAVYAIVEQAGGAIAAKNIPNHGARFEVYFPLAT